MTTSAAKLGQDKCDSDFDAVAVIHTEMWAFKSRHFLRIHRKQCESRGDPVELTAFWYGLPADVDKVDAVYERPDHRIVFFASKCFYVFAVYCSKEVRAATIAQFQLFIFGSYCSKEVGSLMYGWRLVEIELDATLV